MSTEKGLLTEVVENKAAQQLDDLYKGTGIVEMLDGKFFKMTLSILDNKFGEMVKDPYKTEVRELVHAVYMEEDVEAGLTLAFDYLNAHIDIPFLDDDVEDMLFKGLLQITLSLLAKVKPE